MVWDAAVYAGRYPMAPLGGVFVATMGVFVIAGALLRSLRMTLVYVGMAVATVALVLSGHLAAGLGKPSVLQVASLVIAIVVEIVTFRVVMPGLRRKGEPSILVATLAIVGAHFLIMLPAFGPWIGLLGMACVANALLLSAQSVYPANAAWFVDGVLKLAFGAILLLTSPVFGR